MAGFLSALSFAAPIGQTLGPAMQIGAREAERQQHEQALQSAWGKALDRLPPQYEWARDMFKAGAKPAEIASAVGMFGKPAEETARLDRIKELFPTEESWHDPARVRAGLEEGVFTGWPKEALAQVFPSTPKPTGAFEGWAQDVKGYTPEALRALPPKERESLFDEFRKETTKQGEAPLGGADVSSMGPGFKKFVEDRPEVRMLSPREAVKAFLSYTKQAPQERQALEQAGMAMTGFDDMLKAGRKVLPMTTGPGAILATGERWYQAKAGDPNVTRFNATKTNLINHLRAVAGVSRVNQTELEMASEVIQNAPTYPALKAAVEEARKRLLQSQHEIESRTSQYGVDMGDDGDQGQGGGDKTSNEVDDWFTEHGGDSGESD